jgi:hypothetical protein
MLFCTNGLAYCIVMTFRTKKRVIGTLDVAFKKRFFALSGNGGDGNAEGGKGSREFNYFFTLSFSSICVYDCLSICHLFVCLSASLCLSVYLSSLCLFVSLSLSACPYLFFCMFPLGEFCSFIFFLHLRLFMNVYLSVCPSISLCTFSIFLYFITHFSDFFLSVLLSTFSLTLSLTLDLDLFFLHTSLRSLCSTLSLLSRYLTISIRLSCLFLSLSSFTVYDHCYKISCRATASSGFFTNLFVYSELFIAVTLPNFLKLFCLIPHFMIPLDKMAYVTSKKFIN